MVNFPYSGEQVVNPCFHCGRQPESGEVYGTGPYDWDYLDICPTCWDAVVPILEE